MLSCCTKAPEEEDVVRLPTNDPHFGRVGIRAVDLSTAEDALKVGPRTPEEAPPPPTEPTVVTAASREQGSAPEEGGTARDMNAPIDATVPALQKGGTACEEESVNFEVVVDVHEVGIGLDLRQDTKSDRLVVVRQLETGAVVAWNSMCPREAQVREFDQIIAVNDVSGGPQDVLGELRKPGHMKLSMRRPRRLRVTIDKHGGQLAIQLKRRKDAKYLTIESISETGCVQDWNRMHPEFALVNGDHVVEVNGCNESGGMMMDRVKADSRVEFVVIRE
eukprot:NODE_1545_length_1115_cov_304.504717.p1 GENE.NODE_1545_length_1115_cov_304.504717~~NODE_1545_length_1115_cov_304.504717.p1  ORF type:complete len:277 (-),score=39.94 NODE_1545_length_1115_cov_304.504717:206-1036(-)